MIQKYSTLADIVALAEFAHRNQFDKAGLAYIEHPKRVLAAVQAQGALPYVQMAAVLHDVTEDTAFTPQMLLDLGVPSPAVELVKLLDRKHSAEMFESIDQNMHNLVWVDLIEAGITSADDYYYYQIKNRPEAKMIKLADIGDNTLPWRLNYLPEEDRTRLRDRKYKKARDFLNS